jgi:hypothetical protein
MSKFSDWNLQRLNKRFKLRFQEIMPELEE